MRNEIIERSKSGYIDELRFIDSDRLTETFIGDERKFVGRQPTDIMPNAKTVIVACIYIGGFVTNCSPEYGRISRLVLSGYYANIVRPLESIKKYLFSCGYEAIIMDGEGTEPPIPLKGAAVKAGLGWIGKNSLLINTKYGSFMALGAIITDADIGENYPMMKNMCGGCSNCIDTCPSKAIETPQQLNQTKCLSNILDNYDMSIKQGVDTDGYFFECDICQNACPWNQKHIKAPLDTPYGKFFDSDKLNRIMRIDHLKQMDEETYEKELVPLMIGYKLPYKTFKRNITILSR
jgi:epoxyqueuosine reductase QueG